MYVSFEGRTSVPDSHGIPVAGLIRMLCGRRRSMAAASVFAWSLAASVTRASAALLGSNLFPADNPWNQNISQAPAATNSAAIISNIGNGRFHPDFGQDYRVGNPLYGIPYNVVHGNSTPKIHVVIDA